MFLSMIFSLKKRPGIPLDVFYTYWVNAHAAQIAARLPGIDHLWLHEISYEDGQVWPHTEGVGFHLVEEDRFEGVPEPCFESEEHLNQFLGAMEPLMTDEANIFEETVAYPSVGDNSKTYKDETPASFRAPRLLKFMLFICKNDGVSLEDFRSYMSGDLAPALAGCTEVKKLRMHLLEPFDPNSQMADASAVSALAPPNRRFDASIEIAFENGLDLARFTKSAAWAGGAEKRAKFMSACYAFKVNATHNLKRDGGLTFEGLRTPIIARSIEEVTAISQFNDSVMALQTTGSN
ncbi:hypothetical protein K1W69_14715 [Hoeflea sp. WL0058]|uniref:EthD domain-containing protein n=1 Tax=Flavimaribacter sediminis TaxID=2865987 RepID=A0AAE2ZRY3_9HYPH|nr:hypothetical protein [Flavimaribacter sediminis]MBW8638447.1 hypothetical protein [Flavimaribacter sediminis]